MNNQIWNFIFVGINGSVIVINRSTGETAWQCKLKGFDFVNLVIDGENLYATTQGEIFCLDTATGAIRWHNSLPEMGHGLVSIATQNNSQVINAAEKHRSDEAAAAAEAVATEMAVVTAVTVATVQE